MASSLDSSKSASENQTLSNQIPLRICEDLFGDEKTADFHFVFILDGEETRISAHKIVLAKGSPYFDSFFYGGFKKENEMIITDATPTEFKIFLQFFYLSKVTLTLENVAKVMELADRYIVIECLNICEEFLLRNTTLEDVCFAYQLAITYQRSQLKTFCMQKISKNSIDVFNSDGFRDCSQEVLKSILKIDMLSCEATQVFDACLDWAVTACKESEDAAKVENMRKQLGDCIYFIQFEQMTLKQFSQRVSKFKGLFDQEELEEIIAIISDVPIELKKFKRKPTTQWQNKLVVICSRLDPTNHSSRFLNQVETVAFRTNQRFLLGELGVLQLGQNTRSSPFFISLIATMTIIENTTFENHTEHKILLKQRIQINQATSNQGDNAALPPTIIKLEKPIVCDPDTLYEIQVIFDSSWSHQKFSTHASCKSEVNFGIGYKINFEKEEHNCSLISHLYFNQWNFKLQIGAN